MATVEELSSSNTECTNDSACLNMTSNGAQEISLKADQQYNIVISSSSDQLLNHARSSLEAVSGTCSATNQRIIPWTYQLNGVSTELSKGINKIKFSNTQISQMAGCEWKGCVETNGGLISCIKFKVPSNSLPPTPPPSTTCNGTKPPNVNTTKNCNILGAGYSGTFIETITYACNSSLVWQASISRNTETCSRTCNAASKPADGTITKSCATELGAYYTGTYSEQRVHTCDTSNYQWKANITENSHQCATSITKLSALQNVNGNVEIPAGSTAFIDRDFNLNQLTVNGTLLCGSKNYNLVAATILVSGSLECGTEDSPFTGQLSIGLKSAGSISVNYRALIVTGKLKLFGQVKTKMARLSQTAFAGASTLYLDQNTNWKVGDDIAIASTSMEYRESENFKITAINANVIEIDQPLRYQHWGDAPETFQGQTRSFTLDQRAEVVNLTRNIKIEGYDKHSDGRDADFLNPLQETSDVGGHVMIHNGGFARISGVEFYKMGQQGIMGRYPFHWHNLGDLLDETKPEEIASKQQFVKNSSVHKSFQRCITIHGTNDVLVDNNVCYNFRGHGFFLEDGNEINNTISNNIGFAAHLPHRSKLLLQSDSREGGTVDSRFPAVSVFWISNPNNRIKNNIAAGSVGTGFWNSFEPPANTYPIYKLQNTLEYSGNIAHATLVGHTWDGAPIHNGNANNPNNPNDKRIDVSYYDPPVVPVMKNLTAYKNRDAGMYFRGSTALFDEFLAADNGWSFFMAYNQIVKNAVLVGKSKNITPPIASATSNRHVGVVLYDGPFELENVDFYNFNDQSAGVDNSPMPFLAIGGAEKMINVTKSIRFSPNVTYRALLQKYNDPWVDKHISNAIRDLDGTLTGVAGGILLPAEPFTTTTGCHVNSAFSGWKVCPASTKVGIFRITSHTTGINNPFYLSRNDGAVSLTENELAMMRASTNGLSAVNAKAFFIETPNYQHTVQMTEDYTQRNKNGDMYLQYYSEDHSNPSPVFKVAGYGSGCRLIGGAAMSSLAALSSYNGTAYYSYGSSFYVKLSSQGLHWTVKPSVAKSRTHLSSYFMSCDANYNNAADYVNFDNILNPVAPSGVIRGVIDAVDANGVHGWACIAASSNKIPIHIYAGGPAGSGTFAGHTIANQASEIQVAQACDDNTGSYHRFRFNPSSAAFKGMSVWVHGINGSNNSLITNSGTFKFP